VEQKIYLFNFFAGNLRHRGSKQQGTRSRSKRYALQGMPGNQLYLDIFFGRFPGATLQCLNITSLKRYLS